MLVRDGRRRHRHETDGFFAFGSGRDRDMTDVRLLMDREETSRLMEGSKHISTLMYSRFQGVGI